MASYCLSKAGKYIMLGGFLSTFPACNGLFDPYDELPETEAASYEQLQVDATRYDAWTYISLHHPDSDYVVLPIPMELTGVWDSVTCYTRQEIKLGTTTELSSTPTDSQPEPVEWDIAIHHFDLRTNHGSAFETDYTSLDQVPDSLSEILDILWEEDQLTKDRVWVDLSNCLAYDIGCQTIAISLPLSNMASMDVSNPPPIYNISGKVCLLRLNDGTAFALFLDNYMNEKGQKGHLTISIKPLK